MIDSVNGFILAQGYDDEEPLPLAQLALCAVKISSKSEEKSHNFHLITSAYQYEFQAFSKHEQTEWVNSINESIASALHTGIGDLHNPQLSDTWSSTESGINQSSDSMRETSSHVNMSHTDVISSLYSVPGNNICADCDTPNPEWASINQGVLICIECSGIHRGLGVDISKVRSLNLDIWDETKIQMITSKGNIIVNKILEFNLGDYKKPTKNSSRDEREKFIVSKYVKMMFSENPS